MRLWARPNACQILLSVLVDNKLFIWVFIYLLCANKTEHSLTDGMKWNYSDQWFFVEKVSVLRVYECNWVTFLRTNRVMPTINSALLESWVSAFFSRIHVFRISCWGGFTHHTNTKIVNTGLVRCLDAHCILKLLLILIFVHKKLRVCCN